jgi:hypothetical protein
MKKFRLYSAIVGLLFAGNVCAQDITVTDLTIEKGGSVIVPVNIQFTEKAWSGEFNIILPEGITVESITKGDLMKSDRHVVEIHGTKVLAYPEEFEDDVFASENGVFALLKLKASNSLPAGQYTGTLKNGSIGDVNGEAHDTSACTFFITVSGDATGINGITADDPNAEIYKLNGQRVDGQNAKKGVYVVNGKKVSVK